MTWHIKRARWALTPALAALLAACGGGGGGTSTPTDAPTAKTTTAQPTPVPMRHTAEPTLASDLHVRPSDAERKLGDKPVVATSRLYIVQLAEDPVVAYNG